MVLFPNFFLGKKLKKPNQIKPNTTPNKQTKKQPWCIFTSRKLVINEEHHHDSVLTSWNTLIPQNFKSSRTNSFSLIIIALSISLKVTTMINISLMTVTVPKVSFQQQGTVNTRKPVTSSCLRTTCCNSGPLNKYKNEI